MRKWLFLLVITLFLLAISIPVQASPKLGIDGNAQEVVSDAYSMVAAVNDLRTSYGLPPYETSGILMAVAQAHAEYMASSGSVTHYSADGSRPFQRSLAAGYLLAGDLSLGGFHAENIIAGSNMSVYEAVNAWMGDAPHQNTMLSPNLTQIGAGVAIVGDRIFYVIDAARPTGATSAVVTTSSASDDNGEPGSLSGVGPLIATTIMPSTPNANGEVIHQVKGGETLWLIAITYGTKIDILRSLNNLGADNDIYPGQTLIIRPRGSVTTEPLATFTSTAEVEQTADVPQSLIVASNTPILPVITPTLLESAPISGGSSSSMAVGVLIVAAALVLAGVLAVSSRKP